MIFYTISLLLLFPQLYLSEEIPELVCHGGDIRRTKQGCTIFTVTPLIIENFGFDFTDNDILFTKLHSVREIRAGIIVRNNDFLHFVMPNLRVIANPFGYGLIFRRNTRLRTIEFPKLTTVDEEFRKILFLADAFPTNVLKYKESFDSFKQLQSQITGITQMCDKNIIDLVPHEINEMHFNTLKTTFIMGFVCCFLALSLLIEVSINFIYQYIVQHPKILLEKTLDFFKKL